MRKPALSLLSGALALALSSPSYAMSLTEAIQSAIDYHPEIRAAQQSRLSADEELNVAKGGYYPVIDLIGAYGRENTDSPGVRATGKHGVTYTRSNAELRLRQMLFDGFATSSEVDRNESTINSRAYLLQGVSQSIALRAIEVYLDVMKRREQVHWAEENLRSHQRIHDQISLRSERGVGSTADRDQSEARLALAQNNLFTEQVNLSDAETNFLSVIGKMPDMLEPPSELAGTVPGTLTDARQRAQVNNPYLKSAQADVDATEAQYEAAKSPFYPRFDLELAQGAGDNFDGVEGHNNEWRAQVLMNYNLYNGGRDEARKQSTAYQMNEAMEVRNNALRLINEELGLTWNALNNIRQQLPQAKDYAESSDKVRSAYQQQFSVGQRTLLDLLDSENELFTARRRFTELQFDERFTQHRLLNSTGELLKARQVVLPAEATALTEVKSEASLPAMR